MLCRACELTSVFPSQDDQGNQQAWQLAERAKRRWLYSIDQLGLPVRPKSDQYPDGITFRLLQPDAGPNSVLTGHSDGTITINVAECDPVHRLSARAALDEPYRTLIGHFRHESGHFYWQQLVSSNPARLEICREIFGDDRTDYADALQRHYDAGPTDQWQCQFVSGYASSHPWEDFAETWAHYLHMVDALDLAHAWGLELNGYPQQEVARFAGQVSEESSFHDMLAQWLPLSLFANSLNRSLGHDDAYPFAPSERVIRKLHWIHDLIESTSHRKQMRAD